MEKSIKNRNMCPADKGKYRHEETIVYRSKRMEKNLKLIMILFCC